MRQSTDMLLDAVLPVYQFDEIHTIHIKAAPAEVMAAVETVRAREIPGFSLLMGLRSLPLVLRQRLRGTGTSRHQVKTSTLGEHALVEEMLNGGFVLLGKEADRELVLGVVGQFWRPTGGVVLNVKSAEAFRTFDDPRYAKAVMNFLIMATETGGSGRDGGTDSGASSFTGPTTLLRTETRISVGNAPARRRFGLYWRLIRPGSSLIRRMWLYAIKRRAEGVRSGR